MFIVSSFTKNGIPESGLSPKLQIRELPSNTIILNDQIMTELANGQYYYDFSTYDPSKSYIFFVDANTDEVDNRYQTSINENFYDDIKSLTDPIQNDLKRALGLLHENFYIDNPIYDSNNNLIGARVRIYSNALSVGTNNNVIGEDEITVQGDGPGKFPYWKQVKV